MSLKLLIQVYSRFCCKQKVLDVRSQSRVNVSVDVVLQAGRLFKPPVLTYTDKHPDNMKLSEGGALLDI